MLGISKIISLICSFDVDCMLNILDCSEEYSLGFCN
jgi:hypothetical protein